MIKKICDRCLTECDRCLTELEDHEAVFCEMMSLTNNGRTDYFDLCKKCHTEMWEFFLKKKAEYMAEPEADQQPCPPPPKEVEWKRFTPLPPIPTSEYMDEEWIEKPALVGDRQRVADFLKELLKEDRNAYTIVVTKDLVYSLYKIAKEKLNDEMLSQGENTRVGE